MYYLCRYKIMTERVLDLVSCCCSGGFLGGSNPSFSANRTEQKTKSLIIKIEDFFYYPKNQTKKQS